MSVIYDALKKVEVANTKNTKVKTPKDYKHNFRTYAVYVFIVFIGAIAAGIFFSFLTKPLRPSYLPKAKVAPSPENKPIAEVIPESVALKDTPIPPKLPAFALNGIFFSENEGYALINNRIVKEGDAIESATVKKITLDAVELDVQGSSIQLTTNK